MKKNLLVVLFTFLAILSKAQNYASLSFDSIMSNVSNQLSLYPQEKVHLQIDKSCYLAGETMWFRAYLVNSCFHTMSKLSRYIYVELIDPFDSVVSRVKIRPENSMFYGYMHLSDSLPEGNYTLRAYTLYMLGLGEDYFFRRSLKIGTAQSARIETKMAYPDNDKEVHHLSLSFEDPYQNKIPGHLHIRLKTGMPKSVKDIGDSSFLCSVPQDVVTRNKSMLFEFKDESGRIYRRYASLSSGEDDFDVSFFPEGGYLLGGAVCRVAFKALNSEGRDENVTVNVVSERGDTLTTASTLVRGMGYFSFYPGKEEKYYAICENKKKQVRKFELPSADLASHGLKVDMMQGKIRVTVLSASDAPQDSLFLLAHVRGAVIYANWWNYQKGVIYFDKRIFPSGVIQFLLLDKKLNPLSERLAFCNNRDQAKVLVRTSQTDYHPRQLVSAQVRVTDQNEKPLGGNFSVAVVDEKDVPADTCFNILSTLLLTSELKGYIDSPSFYFQKNNKLAAVGLDLLMMTHGWRRYHLSQIIKGNPEKPKVKPEVSQTISGIVRGGLMMNKPADHTSVTMVALNSNYMDMKQTDSEGRFSFSNIEFPDSAKFMVQALTPKGKAHLKLSVDSASFPPVLYTVPLPVWSAKSAIAPDFIQKAEQKISVEGGMLSVNIGEVEVTASKQQKKESSYNFMNSEVYTDKDIASYNAYDLHDVLERLQIIFTPDGSLTFRNKPVFFVVDGFERSYSEMKTTLQPDQIEKIEFAKDEAAASYFGGGMGNYGSTVIITTKKGIYASAKPKFNIKMVTPFGFQKPVAFYSPKYQTQQGKDSNKPDLRTTIFWKPDVELDSRGEASFSFYSADAVTTYAVVIEGISNDGKIIYDVHRIRID